MNTFIYNGLEGIIYKKLLLKIVISAIHLKLPRNSRLNELLLIFKRNNRESIQQNIKDSTQKDIKLSVMTFFHQKIEMRFYTLNDYAYLFSAKN